MKSHIMFKYSSLGPRLDDFRGFQLRSFFYWKAASSTNIATSKHIPSTIDMLFSFITLLCLLQVVPVLGRLSTSTREACVTYWGKKHLRHVYSRTWTERYTTTLTRRIVVVSATTTTKTPSAVISTKYRRVTLTTTSTAPQQTETFTTTTSIQATSISSTTITIPSTTTITTGTTLPPGTTTIGAPYGFLPIQSDPVNSSPQAIAALPTGQSTPPNAYGLLSNSTNRGSLVNRDDYGHGVKQYEYDSDPASNHKDIDDWGHRYPTSVACKKYIEAYTIENLTKTARRTRTTSARTPTRSITRTITSTAQIVELQYPASSTLTQRTTNTVLTTLTISETSTVSTTTTQTSIASPTATAYAVCGADNYLSSYGSRPISDGNYLDAGSNWNYDGTIVDAPSCCEKYV
jgi:hypothetical protein